VIDKLLINNLEFAETQQILESELALKIFPRLSESLVSPMITSEKFTVRYQLKGVAGHQLPRLHLQLQALMPMQCQRCLDTLEHSVSLEYDYVLSDTEPADIEDDPDLDWLEINPSMNLLELIEDELLIALPIAPKHSIDCQTKKMESGEKANPFAVLKGKF
jgi:uncharacterized protein